MISLFAERKPLNARIFLPASKSESNRVLIINALCQGRCDIRNISSARDTQTMIKLLDSEGHVLDVIDAGTTMRFLTAYFAAVGRDQILTGTPRMCKRPIGILVEALRNLGANIDYWKQEGFPPLHIVSRGEPLHGGKLSMRGNVSSQFITAILLIAPTLPGGLRLHLEGDITSLPYIEMTRDLMRTFGVETHWEENTIVIPEKDYTPASYTVESDWSAASYWFSMVALADEANIFLEGLRENSFQGDKAIVDYMEYFGVKAVFHPEGIQLVKTEPRTVEGLLEIDFTETPDLAQTIAVVSAATGIPVKMTGLHTLRIKETDRINAIRDELAKFGVTVLVHEDNACTITGKTTPSSKSIETYEDHRMAMAFAPLALIQHELLIKDQEVVKKSYPEFWEHLEVAGVKINEW
ncbi:MAG: 3-phosphoshikimate 1-carboxyvinyltransferase [Bacteroidia bacterium]|nr:3-phosphoshikimate 1-carboxyvinyltransferase [Bacteroidia bacterium]